MSYEKQNFEPGDILTADALNKIDSNIERIYDDIYDIEKDSSFQMISSTVDSLNESLKYNFPTSTFSGWYAYCGQPSSFSRITFPITVRAGYPISEISVRVYKMPPAEDVTFTEHGVTPAPKNWELIGSTTITYEESLTAAGAYTISADFEGIVNNSANDHLVLGILCSNIVTMGLAEKSYPNIPYNPWAYYETSGNTTNCTPVSGVATYDSTSTTVTVLPVEFYYENFGKEYLSLGTTKKKKFFNLVNDCINNSDSFGEIFTEAYKPKYAVGAQNLLTNKNTHFHNPGSTFTGVIFPIGVIPDSVDIGGCALKIRARAWNDTSVPITKVWAWLYTVDEIPYVASTRQEFSSFNPRLIRTGEAECDIAVDTEGVVTIQWLQGSYTNTEGKFLMLGYNCDTYNCRCFTQQAKTGIAAVSAIDGKSYSTNFDTWYSVQKEGVASWSPHWEDTSSNAWSLLSLDKYYDLGDKFYDMLKEALENTSVDADIAPTSEVRLAKQYDLVVGDKFQLFYDGVVKAFDASKEGITVRCSKGREYPRYWEYTPVAGEEGTYSLKLYTRQLDGSIISQGTTSIVVHPKLTNDTTPENVNILCFGDSLTSGGQWCGEGLRRIYGASSTYTPYSLSLTHTVTTYGKNKATINGYEVFHEGYGGWTWDSFLGTSRDVSSTTNGIIVTLAADHGYDLDTYQKSVWTDDNGKLWELEDFPSSSKIKFNRGTDNNATQANTTLPATLTCSAPTASITPTTVVWESGNPFYNEESGEIDFADHASQYSIDKTDIVACLLTWNGGGGELDFDCSTKIDAHITKATQLLRIVHNDFPDAKIIVMGVQISSTTGGTGANYGADGGYADRMGTAFYAFDYDKALEELVTNSEFGEYCHYVDIKGQFDTKYNMPFTMAAVNARNSTNTEMIGTNGVHPTSQGYYQIGDAFYRALTAIIPSLVQ